jgi:hypothetical protein
MRSERNYSPVLDRKRKKEAEPEGDYARKKHKGLLSFVLRSLLDKPYSGYTANFILKSPPKKVLITTFSNKHLRKKFALARTTHCLSSLKSIQSTKFHYIPLTLSSGISNVTENLDEYTFDVRKVAKPMSFDQNFSHRPVHPSAVASPGQPLLSDSPRHPYYTSESHNEVAGSHTLSPFHAQPPSASHHLHSPHPHMHTHQHNHVHTHNYSLYPSQEPSLQDSPKSNPWVPPPLPRPYYSQPRYTPRFDQHLKHISNFPYNNLNTTEEQKNEQQNPTCQGGSLEDLLCVLGDSQKGLPDVLMSTVHVGEPKSQQMDETSTTGERTYDYPHLAPETQSDDSLKEIRAGSDETTLPSLSSLLSYLNCTSPSSF